MDLENSRHSPPAPHGRRVEPAAVSPQNKYAQIREVAIDEQLQTAIPSKDGKKTRRAPATILTEMIGKMQAVENHRRPPEHRKKKRRRRKILTASYL